MFGLMTTMSPREMNFLMPPMASMAAFTICLGRRAVRHDKVRPGSCLGCLGEYVQSLRNREPRAGSMPQVLGISFCPYVHLTFPLASDAKMPPKQRAAKIMNAVFILVRKSG